MTSHQPLAVIDPQGATAGLYRSEDQGDSWQQLKDGLPEVMTAAPRAAASDPEDGGESFRQILDGIPAINSLLVVHC